MWQKLHQRISRQRTDPSVLQTVESAFPQAEALLGFVFPEAFRKFATTFGPGRLAKYFEIAVPGDTEWGPLHEIVAMNKASNKFAPQSYLEEIHHRDLDRIRRLIYFAETEDGDTIGWDPEEITKSFQLEHRIYFVPRIGPPTPLVDSFTDFVTEICLGTKLPIILPFDAEEWGTEYRQEFIPFLE